MEALLDALLAAVSSPIGPLVVAAVCVIDGIFPPVPSETTVVAALTLGLASPDPVATVAAILVAAALGAIAGDNLAYLVGRRVGLQRFAWMRRPRHAARIAAIARRLDANAAALILTARYVPVGRVAVNTMAGASRMPWRRFAALSVAAGVSWSACTLGIASVGAAVFPDSPLVAVAAAVVLALVLGVVIDQVGAALRRRAARRTAAAPAAAEAADALVRG